MQALGQPQGQQRLPLPPHTEGPPTAELSGWGPLGVRRQGEALLALGLAQRLHGLQQQDPAQLQELLRRREALLRLVDPTTLGDFRWLAFSRGLPDQPASLFLQDPPLA